MGPKGRGVLQNRDERWIAGQQVGGKRNCSPVRQSRASADTVGRRVRHEVRRGSEKSG